MEPRLKERLTGAAVLIVAAAVFVPMFMDDARKPAAIAETNIPPKPATEFDSRLVPLPDPDEIVPLAPEPEPEKMAVADLPAAPVAQEPAATVAQGPAPQEPAPQAASPVAEAPAEPAPAPAASPVAEAPAEPAPAPAASPVAESPAEPAPAPAAGGAPADKASGAASAPAKVVAGWAVQTGVFAARANAEKMNAKLQTAGYLSYIEKIERDGRALYRVRIGPEVLRSEAVKLRAAVMEKLSLKDAMIVDYP